MAKNVAELLVDNLSRKELSMPPTITIARAKGWSPFMMKAVVSGRGDEVIDLVKVSLFR